MNPRELSEHIIDIISKRKITLREREFEDGLYVEKYLCTMRTLHAGFGDYVRLNSVLRRCVLRLSVSDYITIDFDPSYFNRATMEKLSVQSRYEVTEKVLEEKLWN